RGGELAHQLVTRSIDPMRVVEQHDDRLADALQANESTDERGEPLGRALANDVPWKRVRDAEEVQHQRKVVLEAWIEREQSLRDLPAYLLGRVALPKPKDAAQQVANRQQGDGRSVRRTVGFVHGDSSRATASDELEAQSALADPRFRDDADNLPVRLDRRVEN